MTADKPSVFGDIEAQVKAIFWNKQFLPSTEGVPANEVFGILLDRTSFYAESGGQEYDTGSIIVDETEGDATEANFEVSNVQVYNGYVLHTGYLKYGQLKVGSKAISSYDKVCATPFYEFLSKSCVRSAEEMANSEQPHCDPYSQLRSAGDSWGPH